MLTAERKRDHEVRRQRHREGVRTALVAYVTALRLEAAEAEDQGDEQRAADARVSIAEVQAARRVLFMEN